MPKRTVLPSYRVADVGRRSRASGLWSLAVVAMLVGVTSLGASAFASDSLSVQIFDENDTQQDAITLPSMYPTRTAWNTIVVDVPEVAEPGSLLLTVTNLRDYEHGCTEQEVRAGDTTCGPGPDQGELSAQLAVHLGVGRTPAPDDPTACTGLVDVAIGDVWLRDVEDTDLGSELPPIADGGAACLVLGLEFADREDNNLAMGDEAVFDLRVGVQGADGVQTAVLGAAMSAPGTDGGGSGGPSLATTGAAIALWLVGGFTAMMVGRLLLRAEKKLPVAAPGPGPTAG